MGRDVAGGVEDDRHPAVGEVRYPGFGAIVLDVAMRGDRTEQVKSAFAQGGSRARGGFTTTLDALTMLLHHRVRQSALASDDDRAIGAARAIEAVERTRELARGNVSPQLASAALLRDLAGLDL